jgi:surface polysaccharide O-acyltransferase-like enzyme
MENTIAGNSGKKRIASLDVLRTFAIFCVLLTHVTECTYPLNEELMQFSLLQRCFALGLHIIGRLGVPIFFFLTGYLLLDRKYNSDNVVPFWKTHLLPLVITSEIWGIVYYAFGIFNGEPFSAGRLLREILMFTQFEGSQFWYIPQIIGIYIFIPFIAMALSHAEKKMFYFPCAAVFLLLFIPPVLNVFNSIYGHEILNSQINLSFSGGIYGLMLILGYMVKKGYFSFVKTYIWAAVAVVSYAFLLWMENFSYTKGPFYNCWYDSAPLLIAAFAVFNIGISLKNVRGEGVFRWISRSAFGIYLMNNMVIVTFGRLIQMQNLPVKEILLFVVSASVCTAAVFILGLNKKAGMILLYKK